MGGRSQVYRPFNPIRTVASPRRQLSSSNPRGNRSSIVAFYTPKPPNDLRAAFQSANIEVTVRGGTVRIAPALFNNADDIDHCLAVTKKLV